MSTFQYRCSTGSALWQLRLESCNFAVQVSYRKTLWQLRLESRNFSVRLHFGSSGSKVATFQYKGDTLSCSFPCTRVAPYTKPLLVGLSLFFCHPFRFACFWHVLLHMLVCHVQPFAYWSSKGFARRSYIGLHPRGIDVFLGLSELEVS